MAWHGAESTELRDTLRSSGFRMMATSPAPADHPSSRPSELIDCSIKCSTAPFHDWLDAKATQRKGFN